MKSALLRTEAKGWTWSKYVLIRASLLFLSVSRDEDKDLKKIEEDDGGFQDLLTDEAEEVDQRYPSWKDIHCQCHPIGVAWSIGSFEE